MHFHLSLGGLNVVYSHRLLRARWRGVAKSIIAMVNVSTFMGFYIAIHRGDGSGSRRVGVKLGGVKLRSTTRLAAP